MLFKGWNYFLTFPIGFSIPTIVYNLNLNCCNVIRSERQVEKAFCFKNCSSDLKNFAITRTISQKRSEQFWKQIPFLVFWHLVVANKVDFRCKGNDSRVLFKAVPWWCFNLSLIKFMFLRIPQKLPSFAWTCQRKGGWFRKKFVAF